MSPEQAQGLPVGAASDIFSLGSVLAFAATGVSPFGSGELFAVAYRVVHGQPDLTGVPVSLRPVIGACLAKDPAARPNLEQLMHTVAVGSAAYPQITPGRFWPDQVSAVLESGTLMPALPPPTPPTPATPATAAPPAPPGTAAPPPGQTTIVGQPARYAPPTTAAVVRRRRGPRWLLPVVLGIAVAAAAGIALALASSPAPKPPSFLPGESRTPAATDPSSPRSTAMGILSVPVWASAESSAGDGRSELQRYRIRDTA
jgi:hypothetical protein